MNKIDRRSALGIGLAAASAAMMKPVAAQTTGYKDTAPWPGVVVRDPKRTQRLAAVCTCNWSLTRKRALSLEVRDPHDRDRVPIVVRLLFCVLVAGPDKILLGRKDFSLLLDPKLPLRDVADHGIHHRGAGRLRSRLHNDITH